MYPQLTCVYNSNKCQEVIVITVLSTILSFLNGIISFLDVFRRMKHKKINKKKIYQKQPPLWFTIFSI